MPNGPYQPPMNGPSYLGEPPLDIMQYLSQFTQPPPMSTGLGDPSAYPPPGMSPSMPWPGGPQGYQPTAPNEPMWQGPPQFQEPDPNAAMFQPPGMQGGYPQPPQQPGRHPILDKLLSPEMADKAMAAAIFARGFIAPQEAINWAMQIRSQRQAQQARLEQSKAEGEARGQRDQETKEFKKFTQNQTRYRRVYDTGVGLLTDEEQASFGNPEEWDDTTSAEYSRAVGKAKTQKAYSKAAEDIIDSFRKGERQYDAAVREVSKFGGDLAENAKAHLSYTKDRRGQLDAMKKQIDEQRLKESKARTALVKRLGPEGKVALDDMDTEINFYNKEIDRRMSALYSFGKQMDADLAGKPIEVIEGEIAELGRRKAEKMNIRYEVAGGKGPSPATKTTPTTTPTNSKEQERRRKLGLP